MPPSFNQTDCGVAAATKNNRPRSVFRGLFIPLFSVERYADIVLPLFQPLYTFAVPDGEELSVGDAVAVQFGPRGLHTGIVWRLHDRCPDVKRVKAVGRRLYDRPLLTSVQMRFWEWIADYYMCTLGEIMRMALPSMTKPKGGDETEFRQEEFRPRTESFVIPGAMPDAETSARIERRAPKQHALLQALSSAGELRRSECDAAALAALRRKGFVNIEERVVETGATSGADFVLPELTAAQGAALNEIDALFATKPTVLLRGVTGSGKTEIYMHMAARELAAGHDVLCLVPEIAMSSQLVGRFESVFGDRVLPYHSKLADRRRTETYMRLSRSEGGNLIIGTRSALFMPFRRLGLVVVDEEHDPSYKQTEPAPRYHARDAAIMLASMHGARTLLGSATPSLESYAHAVTGKFGLVSLTERYGGAQPPSVIISDTLRAVKRGERHAHFNNILLEKIGERLDCGEQVLLFQNRRGYSPYVSCTQCGWTARCPNCNVTLTLHSGGRLVCHYCGHTEPMPRRCPSCVTAEVQTMGFGTEKVEEEIASLFPSARVVRLDRDAMPSESACNRIVGAFERGEYDIMVGTQVITKGFDFSHVTLVGVLNADNLLNAPDFRASERAFQTMMQFAGRGGRRDVRGEVVIQTSEPDNPVLRWVMNADYDGMARALLAERSRFFYPPYARLVTVTLRHRDAGVLGRAATEMADMLRRRFSNRVFGPNTPPVDRIRNEVIAEILLKIESGAPMSRARMLLREVLDEISRRGECKYLTVICNVDAS